MMPAMHPHLIAWTNRLPGGPGPVKNAEAIGKPAPDAIGVLVATLVGISPVLNYGAIDVDRQSDQLRVGWSAPEPVGYLRALAAATGSAASVIDAARDRLLPAIEGLRHAQIAAARAIEIANSATDWSVLNTPVVGEAEKRDQICGTLHGELTAQRARIEEVIAGLDGVFSGDPQQAMDRLTVPRGSVPIAPIPQVRTVAQRNALRLAADLTAGSPLSVRNNYTRDFAQNIDSALDRARADGTTADLLVYAPGTFHGQGRAAVSVGDLATADRVAILVPGVANSPADMSGTIAAAKSLMTNARAISPGEETAVVIWFGYDIPLSAFADVTDTSETNPASVLPDALAAADANQARAGAELLNRDSQWIRELMAPDATLTMMAHSMGTVVASEAAARFDAPFDNMVLLGSPGAGYDAGSTADYRTVAQENVFVLEHPLDPVTRSRTDVLATIVSGARVGGPYGPDPASAGFGAQVIDAPSGVAHLAVPAFGGGTLTDGSAFDFREHRISNYLSGAAGAAVATVLLGRNSKVRRKPGR